MVAVLIAERDMGRLKEKGRIFREAFLAKLGLLLRGTVAAPPERYGETLADEHIRGGRPPASAPLSQFASQVTYKLVATTGAEAEVEQLQNVLGKKAGGGL